VARLDAVPNHRGEYSQAST
jgi:hypothetical protein